jgi:hypothetical protein
MLLGPISQQIHDIYKMNYSCVKSDSNDDFP